MESKLFNENYENIIKNTIENRSLKVENSIPNPEPTANAGKIPLSPAA